MRVSSCLVVAVALAILQGAHTKAASRPQPIDYVIFIDQTGSVSAEQRQAWATTATDVLKQLTVSDSILILPVHDRTLDAAPLFFARVPAGGLSLEDMAFAKRSLKETRQAARASVHEALTSRKQASSTQLLTVIDRLAAARSAQPGRIMRAYLFSDMVNSTPDLDMERRRLVSAEIPQLVGKIRNDARWRDGALAGVKVFCVLNGIDTGQRATNDRRVLHEFWRAVFTAVGAELETFETHLAQE